MIQFNLLPDIKVEFNKTRKLKRLMIFISFVALGLSVFLIVVTFSLAAVQKNHISNLDEDITSLENEIKATPDLEKILTVQNQLNSLPALFDGRPAIERIPAYIDRVTPVGVELTDFSFDFSQSTIEFEGKSTDFKPVNQFVDSLKFTTYSVEGAEGETLAFKEVFYSDFGRDDKAATYTIKMTFDPLIFDQTKQVTLKVPEGVTTRSQITSTLPSLFNKSEDAAP
jgi:Tfp pilus assembly protein PilN